MSAITDRVGNTIISHPFAIVGVIVAILLISLYGATLNEIETGTATFIDTGSSAGILLDKYDDEFGTDPIILIIEADDVSAPVVLDYIEELDKDIANEPYIAEVISAADIIKQYSGGQIPGNSAEIENIIQTLPQETKDRYFGSEMMTLIFITTEKYSSDSTRDHILQNIDSAILFSEAPPGITVSVSGDPAYDQQLGTAIKTEMGTLIAITIVLMIATLGVLFGYVRYRFLPIPIILGGILMTFGIIGIFGFEVSMPVMGSFPVIIGLGIDYGVQFQSRLNEELQYRGLKDAILAMLRHSGPVHFIAMCTTALGFVALLSAPIPMIRDFGTACLIGVVCSFFLAILAVPLFFRIMGHGKDASRLTVRSESGGRTPGFIDHYNKFLGKSAVFIAKNPVKIILIFGIIAVAGLQYDDMIPINVDKMSYVPENLPAKLNIEKVTSAIGATSTTPVIVRGGDLTDPAVIEWMYEFGEYVTEKYDVVNSHESIATVIGRYNNGKIPETKSEMNRVLSEIPDETRDRYLSGGIIATIEFETSDMEMEELNNLIGQIRKDIEWFSPPPGIVAEPTGDQTVFSDLYDNIISSKTELTLLGIILIIGFLVLVYRRFESLLPVIPVLMVIGWNDLIMYMLDISYTPLTVCLGSMTIGLAMDYTILIMERCREELNKGAELYDAIGTGVAKIGSVITISGLTTIFGFSSMIFSSFKIISAFGQTTVITIFFSLVGGIVVMPAIVALEFKRKGSRPDACILESNNRKIENNPG